MPSLARSTLPRSCSARTRRSVRHRRRSAGRHRSAGRRGCARRACVDAAADGCRLHWPVRRGRVCAVGRGWGRDRAPGAIVPPDTVAPPFALLHGVPAEIVGAMPESALHERRSLVEERVKAQLAAYSTAAVPASPSAR